MEKWLNIEEASKFLKVGRTLLYQLAQEGRIPASKVGKLWKFEQGALNNWLRLSGSIGNFFQTAHFKVDENPSLREPQKEAYDRLYDYFKVGKKVAIVQLPVGCGKSGVAAIAPFGIAKGRVLVITPNLTIKKVMTDSLDITNRKCFWKVARVLDEKDMVAGPYVCTLEESNMSICQQSHFVVTNVQQLVSNPDKWLAKFDSDFFDMIIVDEAHHGPAESWQKVFRKFPNAKIINLTATPFRSDRLKVDGEVVYKYPFRSASIKGFIKRLKATYVTPKEIELTFTTDGDKKIYKMEDVMKMKDETWFSRGVAMSDKCNASIVDNSLQKLEELRQTGTNHQLIGVAMSISHAKKISVLYNERGFQTAVIHSKMKEIEQNKVITDLKSGRLDCIIQVQMLGEGFDHPHLSVAAIFNPFRSLAPYIQFVGRILRVVVQNYPGHPDNYGHIVTHIGLGLDSRLKEFKQFDKDDEEFWAKVIGGDSPPPPERVVEGKGNLRTKPLVQIANESVEYVFEEDFVEDDEIRIKALRDQMELLGFDSDNIERIIKSQSKGMKVKSAATPFVVQPQQAWKAQREILQIEVSNKAKIILNRCDLEAFGREIPFKYHVGVSAANNLVGALIMLNKEVNNLIGKESRGQWSKEEFERAITELPSIAEKIIRQIKAIQNENAKR